MSNHFPPGSLPEKVFNFAKELQAENNGDGIGFKITNDEFGMLVSINIYGEHLKKKETQGENNGKMD